MRPLKLNRLYEEFAEWWPVMSPPSDYRDEAALILDVVREHALRPVRRMLELGAGGGHNASHLKEHFEMTLVDRSAHMIKQSRQLNPECLHVVGDMRTVRLRKRFDGVLIHDAIDYMLDEADLTQAFQTAFDHLGDRGIAVFMPDDVLETFQSDTEFGGHDFGDRSMRYIQWTSDAPLQGSVTQVDFVYAFREGAGPLNVQTDKHLFGIFPIATWTKLLARVGFAVRVAPTIGADSDGDGVVGRNVFVGIKNRDAARG